MREPWRKPSTSGADTDIAMIGSEYADDASTSSVPNPSDSVGTPVGMPPPGHPDTKANELQDFKTRVSTDEQRRATPGSPDIGTDLTAPDWMSDPRAQRIRDRMHRRFNPGDKLGGPPPAPYVGGTPSA
jgi:hypothetical protein